MSNRTRAYRRHHRQRMISRAYRKINIWDDWNDNDWKKWYVLQNHSHMAVCSCFMCGNPRHNSWAPTKERLTIQERKLYNSLCEGIEDYYDAEADNLTFGDITICLD